MADTDCMRREEALDLMNRDAPGITKLINEEIFRGTQRQVKGPKICVNTTRLAFNIGYPAAIQLIREKIKKEKFKQITSIEWNTVGEWKDYAEPTITAIS